MNNKKSALVWIVVIIVIIGTIYFIVNNKSSADENTNANTSAVETKNTSNNKITLTLKPNQASFINNSLLVTNNDGKKYVINYQNAELKESWTVNGKINTKSGNLNEWITDRKIIWAPNFSGPGAIPGTFTIEGVLLADGTTINASTIIQQIQ